MIQRKTIFINFLFFALLTFVFALIQTTAWQRIFPKYFTAPLWLTVVTYFALYRPRSHSLIICYLTGFLVLSFFSEIPPGEIVVGNLAVFVSAALLKSRIYWNTPSYFALINAQAVLVFHITVFLSSWVMESAGPSRPAIGFWLGELLMMLIFSGFLLPLYRFIDGRFGLSELDTRFGSYE